MAYRFIELPKGAVVVLLFLAFVHIAPFDNMLMCFIPIATSTMYIQFAAVGLGVSLLLYPFVGLIADLIFSRYRIISCGALVMCISFLCNTIYVSVDPFHFTNDNRKVAYWSAFGGALLRVSILSFGMIKANIIQFGMDQLTEASGEQLSKFVYWYFWLTKISNIVTIGTCGVLLIFLTNFHPIFCIYYIAIAAIVLATFFLVLAFVLIFAKKSTLITAQLQGNPLKNIFLVL